MLRRPEGVRPWQHVLEPLRGYLLYVEALARGRRRGTRGLNFGPADQQSVSVATLVAFAAQEWQRLGGALPEPAWTESSEAHFAETGVLTLDSRLAAEQLGWASVLDWQAAVTLTLEWYHAALSGEARRGPRGSTAGGVLVHGGEPAMTETDVKAVELSSCGVRVCRGCGARELETVLDLGLQPLAERAAAARRLARRAVPAPPADLPLLRPRTGGRVRAAGADLQRLPVPLLGQHVVGRACAGVRRQDERTSSG